MARNQGFASLSKERRKEIARKGGKAAAKSTKKNAWASETARMAAEQSTLVRLRSMAVIARSKLIRYEGINPDHLDLLKLSDAEMIYFGGKMSTAARIDELKHRIHSALRHSTDT